MAIETQQVHWQGQFLVPDSADSGDAPDTLPLEGEVTFTPVWDERISGFLSDALASIHVRPFTFELHEGRLMSRDGTDWVPGVKLPARIGGVTLGWVAKFAVSAQGHRVSVRDVSFSSNPGGTVSLVGTVPPEAIYPKFSPDVVRGDSVEDIQIRGEYLVFIVGTGIRARETLVRLPGTSPAGPTSGRPSPPSLGIAYFDTDLGMPIWWSGSRWATALGDPV